jgi:hypothetical protein
MSEPQAKALELRPLAPGRVCCEAPARAHWKWFFYERDDKSIYCRVVGCRDAKVTPGNPTGAKMLSLDNHDVLHHLSSKHGITEHDYHRIKQPRLSIQRALTNLDHRKKASTSETPQIADSETSTDKIPLGQSDLALVRLIAGCALPPNILDDPLFRTPIEVLRCASNYSDIQRYIQT